MQPQNDLTNRVFKKGGSGQPNPGGSGCERVVLKTFDGPQARDNGVNLPRFAADGDNFQAVIVIEVDVLGGDDRSVAVVLNVSQFSDDITFVMIVDQYNGADNLVARLPFRLNQSGTDQVADGFGASRTTLGLDLPVELGHQILIERYAETD